MLDTIYGIWHTCLAVAKNDRRAWKLESFISGAEHAYCVFFMRSAHAPQERPERLSMVACNGKGSALCCFPLMTVFQPVTRYRQAWKLQAVTSNQFFSGVTQMYQFIFAGIRRTDLTNRIQKICIQAESELQARAILAREFVLVLAGRINLKNTAKSDRTLAVQGGIYA